MTRAPLAGANARLQLLQKIKCQKGGITMSNIFCGLPPLMVWVPRLIVNNESEFQVNIFNNDRDVRKSQSFCMTTPRTTGL